MLLLLVATNKQWYVRRADSTAFSYSEEIPVMLGLMAVDSDLSHFLIISLACLIAASLSRLIVNGVADIEEHSKIIKNIHEFMLIYYGDMRFLRSYGD